MLSTHTCWAPGSEMTRLLVECHWVQHPWAVRSSPLSAARPGCMHCPGERGFQPSAAAAEVNVATLICQKHKGQKAGNVEEATFIRLWAPKGGL